MRFNLEDTIEDYKRFINHIEDLERKGIDTGDIIPYYYGSLEMIEHMKEEQEKLS